MEDPLTILVIDDDEVDRAAVRRALHASGTIHTLDELWDGDEALTAIERNAYDCILLDYWLPGTDGLALVRGVRSRGVSTPIVVLTGQGDEQLAVDLMKAGATDYLVKGAISPDHLAQSIRSAVRVSRAEIQAARALRESMERLRLLAEASQILSSSLDADSILASLVRLSVPSLADWCAVDLLERDGSLQRAAAADRGGPNVRLLRAIERFWPLDREAPYGAPAVVRSGQPIAYALAGERAAEAAERDLVDRMHALGMSSALCVPLAVRGRTLGALTFVTAESGRRFGPADLVLASDLGQRAAVALDNAHLYHEAREAVRIRDEFLSIASHEFRTPLTSLLGHAQLLERRTAQAADASERDLRATRVIVEQAKRLNRMISSLLDISQLQTGQFSIQHAPVDLVGLARRLLEELRPNLGDHTLHLATPEERVVVLGDEIRLQQVMQNIIQNAAKYSPAGGPIEVKVAAQREWATIAISDQGIGIPKEALPHLFNRFYRAGNVQEQQIGGVGLGLYVVSEIVSLHGGTVEVDSQEGEGSTFTIYLPRETGASRG